MNRQEATKLLIDRSDQMENRIAVLSNALYKIKREVGYLDCECRRPGSNDCVRCTILEIIDGTNKE
jgi:hypothetical protein